MSPEDDLFDFDKQMSDTSVVIKEPTPTEEHPVKKEDEVLIQEEEDEDDDGDLVLEDKTKTQDKKPEEKKQKPTKEESTRKLREQRDEARKLLEAYGDTQPELVQSFKNWISERFPDSVPTQDEILGEFELIKSRDEEVNSLKEEIARRDKVIRELDIRGSEEYKSQYIDPYQEAASYLFTEIAHLDDEGKAVAPNSTRQFHEYLLKNSSALKPEDVKREIARFTKAFKEESHGEYTPPSVATVMSALKAVNDRKKKMHDAYESWETQKNESSKKQQQQQQEALEQDRTQAKRLRKAQATKALNTFDYSELVEEGLFQSAGEFSKLFNEEYKSTERVFEDPNNAPPYSDLLQRGVKARAFDSLFAQYKKLRADYKKLMDENNSTSRGENKGDGKIIEEKGSWHGGELD